MSVEDIQKVNELAQELLDKNFAADRDEAVKKAQEMLNKEITGGEKEMNQEIGNNDDRQNVETAGSSEERLRNMIERTKEYMEGQLTAHKNALIGLEKAMRQLHQEIETLKSRPAPQPQKVEEPAPQPAQQEQPQQAAQPAQQEAPAQEQGSDPNPRTGSHKPDDVSIEKMFYYGNK